MLKRKYSIRAQSARKHNEQVFMLAENYFETAHLRRRINQPTQMDGAPRGIFGG
jgi:hypothetical protein